jgi:hypothetical protein
MPYRVEIWDALDAHVQALIALIADDAVAGSAFAD